MMTVKPEEVGISSQHVYNFVNALNKRNIHIHSLLLMRGDRVFLDCYWAPFHQDRLHRMYSITKSFVSVAVGLAAQDDLIDLDKPIASYFPDKIDAPIPAALQCQTVRHMLTMTTVGSPKVSWFRAGDPDRVHLYFSNRSEEGLRYPGTSWEYDSAGSQVLSALVERVTQKSLFDYLNERIFQKINAFQNARILKTPNGDSWGDSGMLCTPRDLAAFARFVMNYGTWKGERLMDEAYLRTATTPQTHNASSAHEFPLYHGYGYQFWITERQGFAFVGMGDQLAICLPQEDLIMVCTADNQVNPFARNYIVTQLMDCIADPIVDTPLPADDAWNAKLDRLTDSLSLYAVTGAPDSPWRQRIRDVSYRCAVNPLGWEKFSLHFTSAAEGVLTYRKNGASLQLPFAVNANSFSKFPEDGYSHEVGGIPSTDGYRYDCATSAAWIWENKLQLCVQIIDLYFGNLSLIFSFAGDEATVAAAKNAEHFLTDYQGQITATRERE